MKKQKIEVEDRASLRRLAAANDALTECTEPERRALFQKFGNCACAKITKVMADNPAAALGGAIGAILAESFFPSKKVAPTTVKDALKSALAIPETKETGK